MYADLEITKTAMEKFQMPRMFKRRAGSSNVPQLNGIQQLVEMEKAF